MATDDNTAVADVPLLPSNARPLIARHIFGALIPRQQRAGILPALPSGFLSNNASMPESGEAREGANVDFGEGLA
jgi:hypothetical protein